MERLNEIGEDALIERLVGQLEQSADTVTGPGDDCAVIDLGRGDEYQLLKTDCVIEGVHYLRQAPAEQVGWKAVARVISDFAAMGGRPAHMLVTLAMPSDQRVEYMDLLYQGMASCASRFGASICGGETSSVPSGSAAMISIAGTGWVKKEQLALRSDGCVGDAVLVTGKLGGSIAGRHLNFVPRCVESRWLTEHFGIHAMMDLSDGLARDLPRLAKASRCGFQIDRARLPCHSGCSIEQALADGEDYELLLTVPAATVEALTLAWGKKFSNLTLTQVGLLTDGSSGDSLDPNARGGWQHFES